MDLQLPLMDFPDDVSPLRYPGGKTNAAVQLSKFIPQGTKELVSPFIGGASFELYLASTKNIKIYGYDLFYPLVNFWNRIQEDRKFVARRAREIVLTYTRDQLNAVQKGGYYKIECGLEQASMFLALNTTSWSGMTLSRESSLRNYDIQDDEVWTRGDWGERRVSRFERTEFFHAPLLEVKRAHFEDSLSEHNDLVAYCDPPYPEVKPLYGNAPEYHEEFDHELLAEILHIRKRFWMLSYNNCETVKSLYPEDKFRYEYPKWRQGMRRGKTNRSKSNEVLIMPK